MLWFSHEMEHVGVVGKAFIFFASQLKILSLTSFLLLYFLFSFNIAWQKQETSIVVAGLIYSSVSLP